MSALKAQLADAEAVRFATHGSNVSSLFCEAASEKAMREMQHLQLKAAQAMGKDGCHMLCSPVMAAFASQVPDLKTQVADLQAALA